MYLFLFFKSFRARCVSFFSSTGIPVALSGNMWTNMYADWTGEGWELDISGVLFSDPSIWL